MSGLRAAARNPEPCLSTIYRPASCTVPLLMSDFNETRIFSTHFRKILTCQVHVTPSSGIRVVPCGQTDVSKLIVAFRNFSNAPKMSALYI
jgi:hypothetical protein